MPSRSLGDGTRQDTEAMRQEIARVLAPIWLRLSPVTSAAPRHGFAGLTAFP